MLSSVDICRAAPDTSNPTANGPATEANDITEIVVTAARKRNESAQATPLTINAIGAGELERNQITNVAQIQQLVPNLSIHRQQGASDALGIYIRGFGINTNEPSVNPAVAIIVDGIYQAQVNGNGLDLFDLQSIEVLKGPQGTLLGKNSTSGAISVTTKRPTSTFGGDTEVKYERFNRFEARALVNLPINDVLSTKASMLYKNGGNFLKVYDASAIVRDPVTGRATLNPNGSYSRSMGGDNVLAGRLGALFTPNADLDWYVTADYTRIRSPQDPGKPISSPNGALVTPKGYPIVQPPPLACSVFGFCAAFPNYSLAPDYTQGFHIGIADLTSNLNWRTGPVMLTSLTGYKKYNGDNEADDDALPVTIITTAGTRQSQAQFSEEIRVASEKNGGADLGGRLDWVAGVFFFDNKFYNRLPLVLFGGFGKGGLTNLEDEHGHDRSYAGFIHAEYHLTDAWSVTVGGRETHDSKTNLSTQYPEGAPKPNPIAASGKWKNFSPEAGISYKFDPDKLVFVRFAEGYRGGGLQNFPGSAATAIPYDPETVKSWEAGLKSDWFDHRLRVNSSIFYNKYKNLQRSIFEQIGGGASILVSTNAASATNKGFELETIAVPNDRVTVRVSVAYLQANYDKYLTDVLGGGIVTDNSGFEFPYAPKWTGNIGTDLVLAEGPPGKLTLSANYNRVSRQTLQQVDVPIAHEAGYGLADASLRYDSPSRRLYATLYGHNILDKYYFTNVEIISGLVTVATEGMPATFGVTLGVSF
jgi:iron complex outermembrane receptor protein